MNEFWKQRKKLCGKKEHELYNTITEEGKQIENAAEAKEHIANYFENLYQARPGKPQYAQWTERITNTVRELDQQAQNAENPEPITMKELNSAIKTLKRNKATGPDKIPNEALIEANSETREMYRQVINQILNTRIPPEEWQKDTSKGYTKVKERKGCAQTKEE